MGWDFTRGASKGEIVAELTKPTQREPAMDYKGGDFVPAGFDHDRRTLQHKVIGKTLWTVEERRHYKPGEAEPYEAKRYIGCYLLDKDGDFGWGYKSMCESMHPYYFDCPLAYLGMVPVACEPWREQVRLYHRPIVKGQWYALPCCEKPKAVQVVSVRIRGKVSEEADKIAVAQKGILGVDRYGKVWNVSRAQLGEEVAAPAPV